MGLEVPLRWERWDEGGDDRVSWWGERKSEGAREKTTVGFGGFPTRWEPDLFGTGEGGMILLAYKPQGWMRETEREREEFWEKLKRWGGEREKGFEFFFVLAHSTRAFWNFLRVNLSF
jgi:hypothetical protein